MKRVIVVCCTLMGIGASAPLYADHRYGGEAAPTMRDRMVVVHRHDRDWRSEQDGFARQLERRQTRQRARIRRGWRNGELTAKEHRRLKREQRRIAQLAHRFDEDGHYSRKERHILREELDRASEHIYRKRHNARTRYGVAAGDAGYARRDQGAWITFIDGPEWLEDRQGPACRVPRYHR